MCSNGSVKYPLLRTLNTALSKKEKGEESEPEEEPASPVVPKGAAKSVKKSAVQSPKGTKAADAKKGGVGKGKGKHGRGRGDKVVLPL